MNKIDSRFPIQSISQSKKNKYWRKKHLDWAVSNFSETTNDYMDDSKRSTFYTKKINYDLLEGRLSLKDMVAVLNPNEDSKAFIPEGIQHYPIINSKVELIHGEESLKPLDYQAIVTNPTAVSEIEVKKKQLLLENLEKTISRDDLKDEEAVEESSKLFDYYSYEWQDIKEQRDNFVLNHYTEELGVKNIFDECYFDNLVCGEEIIQIVVRNGEPYVRRLDPRKVSVYMNGDSNKIEDADVVVLHDYMSLSQIHEIYHNYLSEKDVRKLENLLRHNRDGNDANEFPTSYEVSLLEDAINYDDKESVGSATYDFSATVDSNDNIRVVQMYWKSRRKVQRITRIDPKTGQDEDFLMPEDYVPNKVVGEKSTVLWINEAWEGTLLGKDIYVNMRPCPIQFNRLNNPSRCHFGIIGTIATHTKNRPFSLVDILKPYSYLYDVIHYRMNNAIANNWGTIAQFDLSRKPADWTVDKWMYYAKNKGMMIIDSFREGDIGRSTGVVSGTLGGGNQFLSSDQSSLINVYANLLEQIKQEMSDVCGINRDREGRALSRESFNVFDKSMHQSSCVTDYILSSHNDFKKRALEALLEVCKICMSGKNVKLSNILTDGHIKTMDIEGEEFSELDSGIVVTQTNNLQIDEQLVQLAHAAMQNQMINFSSMIKFITSSSRSEKIRIITEAEKALEESKQKEQQAQQQMQEQQMQIEKEKQQLDMQLRREDNETRLLVAQIQADSTSAEKRELLRSLRDDKKFDIKHKEFLDKLDLDRDKIRAGLFTAAMNAQSKSPEDGTLKRSNNYVFGGLYAPNMKSKTLGSMFDAMPEKKVSDYTPLYNQDSLSMQKELEEQAMTQESLVNSPMQIDPNTQNGTMPIQGGQEQMPIEEEVVPQDNMNPNPNIPNI